MVAETAYPYTNDNGDTFGNAVSADSDNSVFRYDISVEGQAKCLTDVFQAVANVGNKGLGVFYWEPAWLGVNNISWEQQSELWKKYGSGWATDYAAEYDKSVNGAGGSSYDNQALFDFSGRPLESLEVFRNIYTQKKKPSSPLGTVIENGTYRIKNAGSQLYLAEKGGNAVQSESQTWIFTKNNDDTYSIRLTDGRALTVEDNSAANGANVSLKPYNGDLSQKFILRRNHDDSYALLTASSGNKGCLDVYNISSDDGANICQWEYWGGEGQKFMIEQIAEPLKIAGDVNADGKFDIADIVLFQKWLLAVPNTKLDDWKAADFCEDNRLDVFDLCIMKQEFLNH